MRQQEAKKWIKEIAALANGETIQYYSTASMSWVDCAFNHPSFSPGERYRVKPAPLTFTEALTLLDRGKAIRCESWKVPGYIRQTVPGEIEIISVSAINKTKHLFSLKEVKSNWFEVKEDDTNEQ